MSRAAARSRSPRKRRIPKWGPLLVWALVLCWPGAGPILPPWEDDGAAAHAKPPEERVEDRVDDEVEEEVEDEVEQQVEDRLENRTEDRVEDRTESRIEDRVQNRVEEEVEQEVEHDVADKLESAVEREVEDEAAERAEYGSRDEAERAGAEDRHGSRADEDERNGSDHEDAEQETDRRKTGRHRREGTAATGSVNAERARSVQTAVVTRILDDLGRSEDVIADEVLVLIPDRQSDAALRRMAEQGLRPAGSRPLPALGGRLVRVLVPDGRITAARDVLKETLPEAVAVDYNHLYRPAENRRTAQMPHAASDDPPRTLLRPETSAGSQLPAIGLVDSALDRTHPCFRQARIRERSFLPAGSTPARRHGTMTASVILADPTCGVRGVSPQSPLYLASVFMVLPDWGPATTAEALVEALDWLAGLPVRVVVLALAGPPNALLEAAVGRAARKGLLLFAAAGNDGPHAPPRYPAAYPAVFAVTAVDRKGRPYVHAARGAHVAFAAPGVAVTVAVPGGGREQASGTSFAAAFAGAAAARLLARSSFPEAATRQAILARLLRYVEDLPPAGRDPLTGYGLIRTHLPQRLVPR
ncbi:MAG: hypothetical protein D6740_01190 [Alphaproteobacteria bacterium]|nr:MAG: hypothetical protein D6740_01190 [Alphaproteobacteria bacterium]